MKRITIILFILLLTTISAFAATITDPGGRGDASAQDAGEQPVIPGEQSTQTQKDKDKELYGIGDVNINIGINVAPGISFNSTRITGDGSRIMMFSGQLAGRAIFSFSYFSGMIVELGFQYASVRENQGDTYFKKFTLIYGFVSASYLMTYKDLCIFFGPFVDFLVYGKYEEPNDDYDSWSSFTFPNVGFTFGLGFFVMRSKGFKLYTGFNFKYQFLTFTRITQAGSKLLALYADVTFYF